MSASKTTKSLLGLSFFLPFMIMAIIYALMGTYPFGNGTLLTIDLGQQYIDFFSYYRHTLLNEPSALFYSFAKGMGGEMIGLWSYYLNSPFNILMLLVPHRFLPVGITLLILLKIASSGLAFGYLLIKKFNGNDLLVPTFSLAYALMGYTIVNQLNVMWLDGLVFLPLIVLGIEKIIDREKGVFYGLMLAVMLFANYYIAYMICLFVIIYFIFALVKQEQAKSLKGMANKLAYYLSACSRFGFYSLLGAGLAAFSLLPNFVSLLGGKASYVNDTIDWGFKYPFQDVLSKFYIGAFNFDQMPDGLPNLFIGTLALVCFLYYFFNGKMALRERLFSLVVTLFFFLSMNVNILNKMWHAFQYPIWYPYRFSFVVCFFFILNGFRSLQRTASIPLWFPCALIVLQTGSALYVLQGEFDFVIPLQVLLTVLFLILVLVMLLLRESNYSWLPYALLIVSIVELSTNAAIDLTRLSYVKMKPFNDYQLVLDDMLADLRPGDNEFYRIEKVFQRSKNDSFQANYPSASHFSSTFEKNIPQLYGHLGFPDGNGFVSYSSGTLFTDDFFGIRYLAEDNLMPESFQGNEGFYHIYANSSRPDVAHYDLHSKNYRTTSYLNDDAFSLAFAVPEAIRQVRFKDNQPVENQEMLLDALSQEHFANPFYIEESIDSSISENIAPSLSGSLNKTYTKQDEDEDASIEIQFTTETTDPYYLILDSRIDDDNTEFRLNGERFSYYKTYRNDQVLNLASGFADENIRFSFDLLEDTLTIRDLELYRFNVPQYEALVEKQANMAITDFSQTHIKGTIEVDRLTPILMTTIPYSTGWTVLVDGEETETFAVLGDSLLAADISPGHHTIELRYSAPYFKEGVYISLGSLAIFLLFAFIKKPQKRKH